MNIVPLVLCGGEGSRLWPLTNPETPKHLLKLPSGNTLLSETLLRATGLAKSAKMKRRVIISTNQIFEEAILEQYAAHLSSALQCEILLEPLVKDTAPAITLAALSLVASKQGDSILVVMPADHKIDDLKAFEKTMLEAAKVAEDGNLVSIGIKPTLARSAFGYLDVHNGLVSKFTEKPCAAMAEKFLASGHHLWNSGIFCCKANALIELLHVHCPAFLRQCKVIFENSKTSQHSNITITKFPSKEFEKIKANSIDFQLLNKLEDTRCVEATFGWSDVGSWDEYCDLFVKDEHGNSNTKNGFSESSYNCSAFACQKPVAMLGLKDVVVVETNQAILVADKYYAQNVKRLAKTMTEQSTLQPTLENDCKEVETLVNRETRPWGSFEVLIEKNEYKVKRLIVDPFQSLSLQSHHFRREHWLVVEGAAVATLKDKQIILGKNDHIDIPMGQKHRISNPSHERLVIIETQTGSYLEEDDEIRYEDIYGRVNDPV